MRAAGIKPPAPSRDYETPKVEGKKKKLKETRDAIWGSIFFAAIVGVFYDPTAGVLVGTIAIVIFVMALYFQLKPEIPNRLKYNQTDAAAHRKASVVLDLPITVPLDLIAEEPFGEKRVRMLIAGVLDLTRSIPKTKSWHSRYLEAHRVQLNLREEARQVVQHAIALRRTIVKLGPQPTGTSSAATVAIRAFDVAREPLDIVWDRLFQRVRVLDDYYNHLLALDRELEHAEAAKRALAVDDEIAELLTNAVGDELAAKHLTHLSGEAHALAGAINELVEALNGDLQTLMALDPVSRR
ncbi:hypothetical protein [Rhodococcus spongiicola]|nr:hypothetical protein [Rhodococcus spongiicola]